MIGLLTSSYPNHPGDYRGHFVRDFARSLAVHRKVTVVTPRLRAGPRALPPDDPAVAELGAPGGLFGRSGLLANLSRRPWAMTELPGAVAQVAGWLRLHRDELELVVAHWLMPFGLVAAAVKRVERAKQRGLWPLWIVAHSGGVHLLATLPRPVRHAVGRVLTAADAITFVTPGLRSRFLQLVGRRTARLLGPRCGVLPMGIAAARFAACRPNRGGPVAFVGRLTRLKAVDRVIRGVAQLEEPRGVRIVGDGPKRGRLLALARRLNTPIELIGEVSVDRVAAHLAGASLIALPSRRGRFGRREGLPVALLEGLAAGLPAVIARSWPVPPGLAALPGVHLAPDDDDGYARALRRAIGELGAGSMGHDAAALARRAAAAEYDWSAIGERANRLVDRLVGHRENPCTASAWRLGSAGRTSRPASTGHAGRVRLVGETGFSNART